MSLLSTNIAARGAKTGMFSMFGVRHGQHTTRLAFVGVGVIANISVFQLSTTHETTEAGGGKHAKLSLRGGLHVST
eukprot:11171150-Lingulodinium_polyedra.AAC.1